jgi:hypothetical protein
METRRVFGLIVVILVLGSLSGVAAERSEPQTAEPVGIDSGFVIFDGRYLPPPYMVRFEDGKTYINGFEMSTARRGPFGGRGYGMRRMSQRPTVQGVERIEQHLRNNGMLACSPEARPLFAPVEQAVAILDILLADDLPDAKLQSLLRIIPPWSTRDNWALLVDTFDPPAELHSRVQALKQAMAEPDPLETRAERHWTFLSGFTVTGFALAVWALGTLLSCRPPLRRGWRGVNPSRVCCQQVVWLVVLIVVLNVYDLLCTLIANDAGGLWELNPFAQNLVDHTPMILTFKIALTIGAAMLLLLTRRHRLAQIGSWWAGVLYTVLIVRWATFNSMFM